MKKNTTSTVLLALCLSLGAAPAEAAFVKKDRKMKTEGGSMQVPSTTSGSGEADLLSSAENSLRSMSKAERRQKFRELRRTLRHWRHHRPEGENRADRVLLIVLAVLIPPLAVGLYERRLSSRFWLSLLLTILFFVPGVIYALLVVTGTI